MEVKIKQGNLYSSIQESNERRIDMNEEIKQESLLDGDFSCETTEDWG